MYVNAQENNEFKGLKGLKKVKTSVELKFNSKKATSLRKKIYLCTVYIH